MANTWDVVELIIELGNDGIMVGDTKAVEKAIKDVDTEDLGIDGEVEVELEDKAINIVGGPVRGSGGV